MYAKTRRHTRLPLPERRYLPGKGPRPGRNHIPVLPDNVPRFLYAVDLFNYGYWWECHEVLEDLWIERGKATPTGIFIQGLIQIAAALLKHELGNQRGTRLLRERGLGKLRTQSGVFLGIEITQLIGDLEKYLDGVHKTPPEIKIKHHHTVPGSARR